MGKSKMHIPIEKWQNMGLQVEQSHKKNINERLGIKRGKGPA